MSKVGEILYGLYWRKFFKEKQYFLTIENEATNKKSESLKIENLRIFMRWQ